MTALKMAPSEVEMTLAAVLMATGPVTVRPEHAIAAAGATLIMEQDSASDSWLLRAEPYGPVEVDPVRASVPLLAG